MSSDTYRWICTDRRTEAEVLKELVEADTPVVIVSRDECDERIANRIAETEMPPKSCLFPDIHPDSINYKLLKNSGGFRSLIASPWQYSQIIDISINPKERLTPPFPATLHDWQLQRGQSKRDPVACVTAEGSGCRSVPRRMLRDPVRLALIASTPKLTEFFRGQIERFVESEFRPGNFNAIALRAGVWLWHDAMDESHELAQSIEGKGWQLNGDYWHAILHRREPDYGNAKYWFRRVGRHPNFERLGQLAAPLIAEHAPDWKRRLLHNAWDPLAFVDLCEQAVATKAPKWLECAEAIQEIEMLLLLDSTHHDAARV